MGLPGQNPANPMSARQLCRAVRTATLRLPDRARFVRVPGATRLALESGGHLIAADCGVRDMLSEAARSRHFGLHAGPNFPLPRLESRLVCPACGSRSITVVFEPPTNRQVGSG